MDWIWFVIWESKCSMSYFFWLNCTGLFFWKLFIWRNFATKQYFISYFCVLCSCTGHCYCFQFQLVLFLQWTLRIRKQQSNFRVLKEQEKGVYRCSARAASRHKACMPSECVLFFKHVDWFLFKYVCHHNGVMAALSWTALKDVQCCLRRNGWCVE